MTRLATALARTVDAPAVTARRLLAAARAALAARRARRGPGVPARVRANPLPWAVLAIAVVARRRRRSALFSWRLGRAAAHARELLALDRAAEARAVLDDALEHRPEDPELLLLRGAGAPPGPGPRRRRDRGLRRRARARAARRRPRSTTSSRTSGASGASPTGRRGSCARTASAPSRPCSAPPRPRAATHRLRALTLARDLGAEERIDRVAAYGALLADADCETRRAAARRLGEIGDPAALPALRKAAQGKTEIEGASSANAEARRRRAARPTPRPPRAGSRRRGSRDRRRRGGAPPRGRLRRRRGPRRGGALPAPDRPGGAPRRGRARPC